MSLKILNTTRGSILATHAGIADTQNARTLGLLLCQGLDEGEGLLFPNCNSIHTVGMKFPIDLVTFQPFSLKILAILTIFPGNVWKFREWPASHCSVIELPQGIIASTGSQVGDSLEFIPVLASSGAGATYGL